MYEITKYDHMMVNALYSNNKTGNLYQLTGTAIDCTNSTAGRAMAIYRSLNSGDTYICDKTEFLDNFTVVLS